MALQCGGGSQTGPVAITVTPLNPSIPSSITQQFTATGTLANGMTQNVTDSVSWSSSDTNVAAITATGLATAMNPGSTTITASSGGVSGKTSLSVIITPSLVSISVGPVNPSIAVTASLQFTATGGYSDGSVKVLTNSVTWNSQDSSVASINAAGLATGLAVGSTMITATSGTIVGATSLIVTAH